MKDIRGLVLKGALSQSHAINKIHEIKTEKNKFVAMEMEDLL